MPCFRSTEHAPHGAPIVAAHNFALPGDTIHYAPDRPIDVRHIDLHLRVDMDAHRLTGSCALTMSVLFEEIREVTIQAAEMEIERVAFSSKRRPQPLPLEFDHDGQNLRVVLDRALRYGQEFTLTIAYQTAPRIGMNFVGSTAGDPQMARQAHTQGQPEYAHYWFPCVDFPNERATMTIAARVPQHNFAISNGRLEQVEEHPETGERTFHYTESAPFAAYLATLAVGEFSEIRDAFGDTPVLYYVRPGQEEHARRMMGDTPAMLEYYSNHFGIRYPYEKYAQVCLEEFTGAMENVSATSHTWLLLPDAREFIDWEGKATVAHELVHQWFGDLLTCRDWSHAWLNESFATYFEETWKQADPTQGELEFRLGMRNNLRLYVNEDKTYRRPIVHNVYATDGQELFDRHLYEKGSCVLHMLRGLVGEAAFWRAIQYYARTNRGREVITADLERAFEESTGHSLGRFFQQWVHRGGHPDLEVSYSWDSDHHLAKMTVKQKQKIDNLTPLFVFPVEVAFTMETKGKRETKSFTIQVERESETFVFPLDHRPALVRFDPYGWILKTITFDRPEAMLRWQLANDGDPLGRLEAAEGLAKHATPTSVAALISAMEGDEFYAMRGAAAHSLAKIGTDAALDALRARLVAEDHPKARRMVAGALGEFHIPESGRQAELAASALTALLDRGDPSYHVESVAALSLGKTRAPGAFATLVKLLDRPSWHEIVFGGVAAGLGELGTAEAAHTLAPWAIDVHRPMLQRSFAINGLAVLIRTGRLDPQGPVHQEIRESLEVALRDHWVRSRTFAAQALRALDDARALPAIDAAIDRELESRTKRILRLAAHAIRSEKTGETDIRKLRRDLDELKEDQRKLRDRVAITEATTGQASNGQNGNSKSHVTAGRAGTDEG